MTTPSIGERVEVMYGTYEGAKGTVVDTRIAFNNVTIELDSGEQRDFPEEGLRILPDDDCLEVRYSCLERAWGWE